MSHTYFLKTHIAGFSFYEGAFLFDKLKIGKKLSLKFEKNNSYDPNAIEIYFEKKKIGYIPRSDNSEIAKFFQAGYDDIFEVIINQVNPQEHPEHQIGITIFIKNK